jgi:hypothetical protein
MNKGVEILLARMESNPEEFIPDLMGAYPVKWRKVLVDIRARMHDKSYRSDLTFLTQEEVKMLWAKMQSIQGDLFTKHIMNTLLQDESYESMHVDFKIGNYHSSSNGGAKGSKKRDKELELLELHQKFHLEKLKAYMETK